MLLCLIATLITVMNTLRYYSMKKIDFLTISINHFETSTTFTLLDIKYRIVFLSVSIKFDNWRISCGRLKVFKQSHGWSVLSHTFHMFTIGNVPTWIQNSLQTLQLTSINRCTTWLQKCGIWQIHRVGLGTEGGGWCACYSFRESPSKWKNKWFEKFSVS